VSPAGTADVQVAVIGGGVVGCAVAHALAQRDVQTVLVEAREEVGLEASGTNSGLLHTGFDSKPGELETELILRANRLRDAALETLDLPVLRCGAVLAPTSPDQRETVRGIARNAERNGVEASLAPDGTLRVPGEWVTDPAALTAALAAAAAGGGAEIRLGARVVALAADGPGVRVELASGERLTCQVAVNAAGLHADEVAGLAGDRTFEIYPRKGEFFVFDPPEGEPLSEIILPVPTARTKGVLVFPTVDGRVIAGPTAVDGSDKGDWSVREEAWREVMEKAVRAWPPLEGCEPIASYAGLRPAGRGVNYEIGRSAAQPSLVNVAAVRSTGVSASLGIGAYVTELVAELGVELRSERRLTAPPPDPDRTPWWRRAERRSEASE
jgi:glycerol-3-phosphate dehydrogenase